tara:strand:- start:431 stop:622 length:192 start_codon:yes stop_codon:yes gene_type:complete
MMVMTNRKQNLSEDHNSATVDLIPIETVATLVIPILGEKITEIKIEVEIVVATRLNLSKTIKS